MKSFIATSGTLFALLALVHVARLVLEGAQVLRDPWWDLTTAIAVLMTLWSVRLLRART